MQYSPHAGGCCGISVVHGFDYATVADFDRVINRHDTEHDHGTPGNRLLEAVLTDRQLDPRDRGYNNSVTQSVRDAGGWAVILAARGFVLHTRFQNSNSDRYCNVFHRVSRREPTTGLRWQDQVAPPLAPPEEPAIPFPRSLADITRDHIGRDDIVEFHDGRPMRIIEYGRPYGSVQIFLCFAVAVGAENLVLPCGSRMNATGRWWFSSVDGHYIGLPTSAGAIRLRRRTEGAGDPEAAQVPVPPAPQAAPNPAPETVWSTSYLDSVEPFVGLRVQYRHRDGVGSTRRMHNRTGVITRIYNGDATRVQWDDTRGGLDTFGRNRFVWDTAQLPDPAMAVPEPEDVVEAEPGPVFTRVTEYYAVRRDGTRAGPFESEEQARQRWSRVRQYVRRDIVIEDGVWQTLHETEIAA